MSRDSIKNLLAQIPSYIEVVAATKKRTPQQILLAASCGIKVAGENYVQEAEKKISIIGKRLKWHLIGHLQKNKVRRAVRIFDMIETLDSFELAKVLNQECNKIDKIMPVLIEVNSSYESQKTGLAPESLEKLIDDTMDFSNIKLMGLMTMGPLSEDNFKIRSCFRKTKSLFDIIASKYKNKLEWRYLSMGMSFDYKIAIEEGANIVRLGTILFG
jgi:pyridoxal phosphate enzyme (YggS family)